MISNLTISVSLHTAPVHFLSFAIYLLEHLETRVSLDPAVLSLPSAPPQPKPQFQQGQQLRAEEQLSSEILPRLMQLEEVRVV